MIFDHDLKASVRTIPDYPKPGIMFRDITTLLGDARAFRRAVDELVQPWAGRKIDKVAGIEARGFILGGAVAHQVSAGFVPIRKKGKLPHTTVRIAYSLEYGIDEMEMHADAVHPGERVILVVAKAAGLSWPTTNAILALGAEANPRSPDDIKASELSLARLSQATAQKILDFHRLRERPVAKPH